MLGHNKNASVTHLPLGRADYVFYKEPNWIQPLMPEINVDLQRAAQCTTQSPQGPLNGRQAKDYN